MARLRIAERHFRCDFLLLSFPRNRLPSLIPPNFLNCFILLENNKAERGSMSPAGPPNDSIPKKTMENTRPTLSNGKVCYIEIPAIDIDTSASFYKEVFGWKIRQRGDGQLAFDDGVGEVSGTWVVGRKAATEPGLLIYIMVDSVATTADVVIANGGKIVQPIGVDAPEITARFSDPAGNVLGLYQEPAKN
jgi:predicted enzyme related to lactoylglutathione lyase